MAGRQTIPGAKAPVPKKKSAKAKAEAKEAKKAKKPSTPKGTGKIDILTICWCLYLEGADNNNQSHLLQKIFGNRISATVCLSEKIRINVLFIPYFSLLVFVFWSL